MAYICVYTYTYIREQEKVVHLNYICEYKKLIKFFGATLVVVELTLSLSLLNLFHTHRTYAKKNLSAYLYHLPIFFYIRKLALLQI